MSCYGNGLPESCSAQAQPKYGESENQKRGDNQRRRKQRYRD